MLLVLTHSMDSWLSFFTSKSLNFFWDFKRVSCQAEYCDILITLG